MGTVKEARFGKLGSRFHAARSKLSRRELIARALKV